MSVDPKCNICEASVRCVHMRHVREIYAYDERPVLQRKSPLKQVDIN